MVDGKREGQGDYLYPSGNKYSGSWKNDKKHGEGILYFTNGDHIQAEWSEGSPLKGHYIYAENGNYYQGSFTNEKFTSGGYFVFKSTGMYYQGEYLDNRFHGQGKIFNQDQSLYYEGMFQNDQFHGPGTIFLPGSNISIKAIWEKGANSSLAEIFENEVCIFKSPVKSGKKEGKGEYFQFDLQKWGEISFKNDQIEYILTFHLPNNDYYSGHFDMNLTGKGKYFSHEGSELDGTFEKGICVKGRITYKNGDIYEGDLKNNERSGVGKYTFTSGSASHYSGEWLNSNMHGKGQLFFKDKSHYNGTWHFGKMAEGELNLHNGDKVQGTFKDDELFIDGTYFFKNGDRFEGPLINFKKDGPGKYFWNDKSFVEGYWEEDLQFNSAKIVYQDNSRFEGIFEYGLRTGEGVFFYPDGQKVLKVTSSFEKGVKHGMEQVDFSDGSVFKVNWINGKMDQHVSFKAKDYSYEGAMVNYKKHGQGKEVFSNQDIYEGSFKDDLRSGLGLYFFADGSHYNGSFKNGLFHGKGLLTYSNKDTYEGSFKKGNRSGKGTYKPSTSNINNGQSVSGTWKEEGKVVSQE
jgi:hypothetical protein